MASGRQQLLISTVYAKDQLRLWDSRSAIFTYDLNVKEGPAKAAPDVKETVPTQTGKSSETSKPKK